MDQPLGSTVGNAIEVIECIEALKGQGRDELLDNSLQLSERMLVLAGAARDRAAAAMMCRRALDSGEALERFRSIFGRQGGDPRVIDDYSLMPQAPHEHVFEAPAAGFVTQLDAGLIGRASVVLGAGRDRIDDVVDPAVGFRLLARVNEQVAAGDPILRIQYREPSRLRLALPLLAEAVKIGAERGADAPLVLAEVM